MNESTIGIGDIGLYVPSPRMDLDRLLESRKETHPELEMMLKRSVKKTGQKSFRFPQPWEDTASMAANAAAQVLNRLPGGSSGKLRYLSVGTETAIDHSKPTSAYVQGMLEKAGFPIGRSLGSFEVKHACAGGTAAMLSSAAMLSYTGTTDERALAICSDIARYDAPSTAEITQGAGAAALLLERNPRLLEIDLRNQGYFSSDVDDFFRPLGSVTAKVKGRYSMECYQEALEMAFLDYCNRNGRSTCDVIASTDYIALHVPFVRMPETALRKLLKNTCGLDSDAIESFIDRTGFLDALQLNAALGNLYSGSLYAYVSSLLHQEYKKIGDKIVGKKILVASYGSGNTMIVYAATVASAAGEVIKSWNLPSLLTESKEAKFEEYLNWLAHPKEIDAWRNLLEGAHPEKGQFYLKDFGETGLRIYGRG